MRVFNRIRRKLLEELKIQNYALYALGEIVLIVAGILLALQINNWNQDRNTRREESRLLEGLQQNFMSNQLEIKSKIREYDVLLKVITSRIEHTGPDVSLPESNTLDSLVRIDYVQMSFIFGGLAPALSQEKLAILGSQKLIIELNRFPIQYARYENAESSVNALADSLRETHQRYVSILNEDTRDQPDSGGGSQAHHSDYLGWLRDRSNQNESVESKWKVEQAVRELVHLKADNSRILALIAGEMG